MRIRNVCSAALLWSAAILASGCKGTEPPVATTIVVLPGSINFVTLNVTQTLSAKVLDQKGDSMLGQVVTWSVDNAAVATVSNSGIATAKANGTATITAAIGGVTKQVAVTVAQVAAILTKSTGDGQTGTVGAVLATPLTVHVQDAGGAAVPGASVAFSVTSGGGTLIAPATLTNAAGDATAGWTLGTLVAALHTVNVASGSLTATFAATATAGAATSVAAQAGNNQTRLTGLAVTVAPSAKVVDAFGNAKANVTVVFAVVSGGGSVTGATQTTDVTGVATVGSWSMGPAAGGNSLSATVQGTAISFTFAATATSAGAPTTMTMLAGSNNQTGLLGYGTNVRPAVTVTDGGGQPVAGVSVTFAVASGGGSVTTATLNTNASGIAQVGKWTLGAAAGANTLTATAGVALTGNPATITATGVASSYNIVIQPYGPAFSPTIQAAFDSAEAAWETIIIGDQSDVAINTTNACGVGQTINTTVDDVIILATFEPIDGPGNVLGSAGVCSIRVSNSLTIYGLMRFDIADTTLLSQGGNLNRVLLHEMGHVLGFSSAIWNTQAGITQQHTCALLLSATGNLQDTYFNCPITLARFDSIGGTTYTGGNKVPLENCVGVGQTCGQGNFNSHWRELVFGLELMTPFFNGGQQNLLSVLSITTFEDIGYQVNYGAAEAYTKVFTTRAVNPAAGSRIDLSNDLLRVSIQVIDDHTGRVVRVIQP